MVQAHLPKNRVQWHLNLQPATIPDHTTFCQGFWVGAYYERKLSRYLIEIHLGMSENGVYPEITNSHGENPGKWWSTFGTGGALVSNKRIYISVFFFLSCHKIPWPHFTKDTLPGVPKHIYINIYIQLHNIYIYLYIHIHIHIYIHKNICTYIYIYIHIYNYIILHIHRINCVYI